ARSWLMVRVPRSAPSESAAGAGKRRRWSAERRAPAIASGGDTPRKRVSGGFRRPLIGGLRKASAFLGAPLPSQGKREGEKTGAPRASTKNRGDDACLGAYRASPAECGCRWHSPPHRE